MRFDIIATSLAATDALEVYPHPDLPPVAVWPGVVIIIIVLGFFVTAMILGPIVRAIMQAELPPLNHPAEEEERKRAG